MPSITMPAPSAFRLLPAIIGLGLTAVFAGPASSEVRLAQDRRGVDRIEIGGRAVDEIGRLEQASTGRGAQTRLDRSTVERPKVRGNLAVRGEIGRLAQIALGQDALAATAIGTISDTVVGGDLSNSVTVGNSIDIAIGAGARACTELGVFGISGVCR